jgi:hypothetical protein
MADVTKFIIYCCESVIAYLQPGIEIPKERLNYKKAATAIAAQSEQGKLALFKQLAVHLKLEDRRKLSVILLDSKLTKNIVKNGSVIVAKRSKGD